MNFLSFSQLPLISYGGFTLVILLICALLCGITIIERFLYFQKKSQKPLECLKTILNQPAKAKDYTKTNYSPMEYVLQECIQVQEVLTKKGYENIFDETKERAITEKLPDMERYLGIQAALGTISPYIGLLGTVFGIIRAFGSLGSEGGNNPTSELNAGIAQALAATAAGLLVAIPATTAYNHFRRRMQTMLQNIEIAASYLKMHLFKHSKTNYD